MSERMGEEFLQGRSTGDQGGREVPPLVRSPHPSHGGQMGQMLGDSREFGVRIRDQYPLKLEVDLRKRVAVRILSPALGPLKEIEQVSVAQQKRIEHRVAHKPLLIRGQADGIRRRPSLIVEYELVNQIHA